MPKKTKKKVVKKVKSKTKVKKADIGQCLTAFVENLSVSQ